MRETIAVGLVLPFGCLDDPIRGMNHFVEHLLFNSKVAKDFLKIFNRKGILYNGVTSYEYILFYCQGLRSDRQLMIDFCESLLDNFEITEEEFEKEKKIVLSEIDYYSQNKIEIISNILVGNTDSLAILGSKDSVSSITRLDILGYVNNIKKTFAIADSDGEIITTNSRSRKRVEFVKNKNNTIKVIRNQNPDFNQYYGIGINVNREFSKYFKVFIDMFFNAINDEFREKSGLTYRIHSNSVQTSSLIQNQFIFSVANEIYYLEVIKRIVDIFINMKQNILNLNNQELEEYLERLETRSAIKLDNRLGMMKYNALRKIYRQSEEVDNLLLEDDIKNTSLTVAVYNIDENNVRRECNEFTVELI
ncbi:MAG: insulinase family protein [Streptococcus mitis]|nr:insulinase family protein [Streptococcus mitis]